MKKIILVDDKEVYRNAIRNLLLKLGNVKIIAEAKSGTEFLKILKTETPDIVFMDIEMPDLNGIEATREALKINKNLVIIGLSLYEKANYVNELMKAGARGYLLKLSNNISIFSEILENPTKKIYLSAELETSNKDEKKVILVADDFRNTLDLISHTLTEAGYKILKAIDGKDAVRQFNGQKIDFLITDLHMPRMNGFELIEAVKQIDQYKKIPILMLTTEVSQDKKMRAKSLGVTGWIQKPFVIYKFLKIIAKILK